MKALSRQTLAQIALWTNPGKYDKKVYSLQSTYIGVPREGPFKADHYRY